MECNGRHVGLNFKWTGLDLEWDGLNLNWKGPYLNLNGPEPKCIWFHLNRNHVGQCMVFQEQIKKQLSKTDSHDFTWIGNWCQPLAAPITLMNQETVVGPETRVSVLVEKNKHNNVHKYAEKHIQTHAQTHSALFFSSTSMPDVRLAYYPERVS